MDLAGYHVYRRKAGGTAWTRLTDTLRTTTSYVGSPPATGAAYACEVRAVDKAGNVSPDSTDAKVTTVDRTAPAAPTGLAARVRGGAVETDWTRASGVASYRLSRASSASGTFTRIATLAPSDVFRDISADIHRRWYYRVRAVDAAGNVSAHSATADTGAPDVTPPARVTGITAAGTTAGNVVRRTANTDDTHHYPVWGAPLGQEDPDGPAKVTGASYTDAGSWWGTALHYRVQAVDHYGNVSPVATGGPATRPRPPTWRVARGAWRVDNTTYDSGVHKTTGTRASWTPPASGGYWMEVWTVGAYGTVGESTEFDFVVG
ncbi:hypothetical protein [Streptomyces sp. NPDC086023]|uniref:hypothetical protein n=1 Tax=Streptomyces sp. NPDC086023 TaxID=3365746 RepID=UPI0037D417D0